MAIDPGVAWLLAWEASDRADREAQEWAHDNAMRKGDDGDRARLIHDFHACPKCSIPDSGTLRGDGIPASRLTPEALSWQERQKQERLERGRAKSRARHRRKKEARKNSTPAE